MPSLANSKTLRDIATALDDYARTHKATGVDIRGYNNAQISIGELVLNIEARQVSKPEPHPDAQYVNQDPDIEYLVDLDVR